ncbi:hypothetical protein Acr_27g0000650 [Actinidia rufa]|uniref:Retrotransposon gag domain-containing protein n=1 Tax=Actinidia rufa TaxID=165716 RepID=A0A7J0H5F1_9ERIC|nr:hypothetical protein Acr_27g0000650 [Actinidia rufa]
MANTNQVPDLKGLHREIHDMAEQMRIMNENNGRLMQLLTTANPPLPAAPPVPAIERSRHSIRLGDRSQNVSTERVRGRRRAPSPSSHGGSSSESSKTPARARRGRSPHRGDHTETRNKFTSRKIRDLDARIDAINIGTNAPVTVDTLIRQTEPPFTQRVLRARISSKFKLPAQLGVYEGKTDPMDHLDSYKSLMLLQGCSDEVMCKAFSATLKGPAKSWFRKLSPGTIDSFGDLSQLFVSNFMSCRNRQKNASHLFTDPSDKVIIMAMMEGLRPGPLFDSLSKNVPETLSALQSKADKYIAAEELAEAKRRRRGKDDHKRKEPNTKRNDYREETRYKRLDRDLKRSNNRRLRTPPRRPEFILPPLNAPIAQLKEQIADLIKKGLSEEICRYLPTAPTPQREDTTTTGQLRATYKRSMEVSDRAAVRLHPGKSMSGVPLDLPKRRIYNLSASSVGDQTPITFSNDDLRGLHLPHDDALVVSAVIANFNVQRILIDNGSSADILFISAFERMKIGLDKLHPFHTPLIGFWRKYDAPLGMD